MPRKRNYASRIHFREEWFTEDDLRPWICKVNTNEKYVYCRFCQLVIRSHKADLKRHCRSQFHKDNVSCHQSSEGNTDKSSKMFVHADDGDLFESTMVVDAAKLQLKLRRRRQMTILAKLKARKERDEKAARDAERHAEIARNRKPRIFSKFQVRWLTDPRLKDWVARCENDETTVHCKSCDIYLRAHRSDLTKHEQSMKHKLAHFRVSGQAENVESVDLDEPSNEVVAGETSPEVESEHEVEDRSDEDDHDCPDHLPESLLDVANDEHHAALDISEAFCNSLASKVDSLDAQSAIRRDWLHQDDYQWILPVDNIGTGHDKYCQCTCCGTRLRYHKDDIEKHCNSNKHLISTGQLAREAVPKRQGSSVKTRRSGVKRGRRCTDPNELDMFEEDESGHELTSQFIDIDDPLA